MFALSSPKDFAPIPPPVMIQELLRAWKELTIVGVQSDTEFQMRLGARIQAIRAGTGSISGSICPCMRSPPYASELAGAWQT